MSPSPDSPLDPGYVDPVMAERIRRMRLGRDVDARLPGAAGPGFAAIQPDGQFQEPLPAGAYQPPQASGIMGQSTGQPQTPPSKARMDPRGMAGSPVSPVSPAAPQTGGSAPPPATGTATPASAAPAARQAPPGVTNYAAQMAPLQARQAALSTPVGQEVPGQPGVQGERPVLQNKGVGGALQRVAMALLSATKFAPYAQQIVHPQFTQQLATNAAQLQGIQDQLGTLKEQATAQREQAVAAEYGESARGRRESAEAQARQRHMDAILKPYGEDAIPLQGDMQAPDGYNVIDDISAPGIQWALPPNQVPMPAGANIPGYAPDAQVPWSVFRGWQKSQEKIAEEQAKLPKGTVHTLQDGSMVSIDPKGTATPIMVNGKPAMGSVPPQTEVADLEINGAPHKVLVSKIDGKVQKDLGPSGIKPSQTTIINAADQAANRETNAQMIANYESAPLASFVMRTPEGQAIMARVKQINPEYHSEYYNNFNKTESDATTGRIGTQSGAINTMMGHLGMLNDAIDGLKNNDIQVINRIGNALGVQLGRDPVTTFNTIVHRLGPEITKAYIASGGTGTERGANEEDFNPRMSPDQLKQNVRISAQLAASKIDSLNDQYQRGTYGRGKQQLISAEANAIRQKLAGGGAAPAAGAKTYTQANVDAAVAANPGLTAAQIEASFKAKGWTKK